MLTQTNIENINIIILHACNYNKTSNIVTMDGEYFSLNIFFPVFSICNTKNLNVHIWLILYYYWITLTEVIRRKNR